ncbi:MAG: hypothetical protein MK161_01410, partial [Pirellulales bacterium]|nr:hypothetical protein [Pirellulales bacterium]
VTTLQPTGFKKPFLWLKNCIHPGKWHDTQLASKRLTEWCWWDKHYRGDDGSRSGLGKQQRWGAIKIPFPLFATCCQSSRFMVNLDDVMAHII